MYRIIGADGREYGPFSADQLRQWIAERRATAGTSTLAEGATEWKPLGSLPEFSMLFTTPAPAPAPATLSPVPVSDLRNNGMAVSGFILGVISCLLSLCCCCIGPMCAILGIIFSLVGISQINRKPDVYKGKGFAIFGLLLSILGLVLYVAVMALGLASMKSDGHIHHGRRL